MHKMWWKCMIRCWCQKKKKGEAKTIKTFQKVVGEVKDQFRGLLLKENLKKSWICSEIKRVHKDEERMNKYNVECKQTTTWNLGVSRSK